MERRGESEERVRRQKREERRGEERGERGVEGERTYYRTFHVYQHVTSLSHMRIALVGKTRRAANQPSQQRLDVTLQL